MIDKMTEGLLVIFLAAVIIVIVVWGTQLPNFNIGLFLVFVLPVSVFVIILCTRSNPLEFLILSIICLSPVIGIKVPPRQFDLSLFHLLCVVLLVLLIYYRCFKDRPINVFPVKYAWVPIVLLLPSVMTSISVVSSLRALADIVTFYVFFICLYDYLQKINRIDMVYLVLAVSLITACLAVIFEHYTGISLAFASEHLGKIEFDGGMVMRRSAGFFQDPQKAAQFIAVSATYLIFILLFKCSSKKWPLWMMRISLIVAIPAMLVTATKASILSAVAVWSAGFVFFNRFSKPVKFLSAVGAAILVVGVLFYGFDQLLSYITPDYFAKRLAGFDSSAKDRLMVWRNTWHIFSDNPITGIGLGAYREYIINNDTLMKFVFKKGGYVPSMPESGYLKILYEGGLIGALGAIYLLIGILITSVARFFNINHQIKYSAIACSLALLVFFASFTTIYTVSDDRNGLLFVVIFSALFSGYAQQKKEDSTG